MARETLLDFFADFVRQPGTFLIYDDGYRSRAWLYRDVGRAARAFAGRLGAAGIARGDTVAIWCENRPEWVVALWGCLLAGVVIVPVDYRSSAGFLRRVQRIVGAKVVLAGQDVQLPSDGDPAPVWLLADVCRAALEDRPAPLPAIAIDRDTVVEIIFTSGATADPKGVTITHRNILANIVPIEREMRRYLKYARPFRPVRFLNLLPLSHMFGQAMATFIPPMLGGEVVFERGYNPQEIVRQIRRRRISVLVCVPKLLDVLREHVLRHAPETAEAPERGTHWLRRWWRYRRVHRLFGWKFWCAVVGAAPLDTGLEEFWSRLGFLVVQGYGLTETAPIVTLNHPFRASKGTVGKPIAGVEVRIAQDGEILVRGDNVTAGYFNAPDESAAAFKDGWFHTGDIGTVDAQGRLSVRGRKKEMIVTPQGLNVFPEDVERVLDEQPGVVESAVVGLPVDGEERVHAALVLREGTDVDEVIRGANRGLEDYQRVRVAAVWPGEALPRTEGTQKLRRREVQRWMAGGRAAGAPPAPGTDRVDAVLARFASGRRIGDDTTLEALGLSSLERVELMMALEERFQTTIDESTYGGARTVADLRALLENPGADRPTRHEITDVIDFPGWNRGALARSIRRVSLPTWILPLARVFAWVKAERQERLDGLEGPVIFAANHQSHMDTPAILAALPGRWRYRVAPAMAKEFFAAHFHPAGTGRIERLTNSLNYYLAALFFNAFPLPQREAGTRQALRYVGELLNEGYSLLIFPEGRRNPEGAISRFQPGVGMMASRLGVPVVPLRLIGSADVLPHGAKMARPGRVRVVFGDPIALEGEDYAALAARVEQAVRVLGAGPFSEV